MILPLLILNLCGITLSAELQHRPLKDVRPRITVFPYTPEQRIYVNRESKIAKYQAEYPDIDPIPRVDDIIKNAAEMKDIDFHYKFMDLFRSLHDAHTTYTIPGVHGCILAFKFIRFAIVGETDNPKIVVSNNFSHLKELQSVANRNSNFIGIGDELISIDGTPIMEYIQNLKFVTGGGTESGSLRNSLQYLYQIDGRLFALPKEDSNTYIFRSHSTGVLYQVKLPWLAFSEMSCYRKAKTITDKMIDVQQSGLENELSGNIRQLNSTVPTVDETIIETTIGRILQIFLPRPIDDFISTNSNIKWSIHNLKTHNMGVIYLSNFRPYGSNALKAVEFIRKLLVNELKNTRSILFDVRQNSGGLAELSDIIPQLFGMNIKTTTLRAINNDINKILFASRKNDIWANVFDTVESGDIYTPSIPITSNIGANYLGQAYVKPVGVFTDGGCYSACDNFVANMKDNGVATIFGEDRETGGGGSSPIAYNSYLRIRNPENFPIIPYQNLMPEAAQDFKVAWRQIVRIDGTLIEDIGIKSDVIIRPTVNDIVSEMGSRNQFDRISDVLNRQAILTGQINMHFEVTPHNEMTVVLGSMFTFLCSTRGYDKILINDESGEIVAGSANLNPKRMKKSSLTFTPSARIPGIARYNIRGTNSSGHTTFSTWRTIKLTPDLTKYHKLLNRLAINFKSKQSYAVLFENSRNAGMGWNSDRQILHIGDGIGYVANIDSRMSYFITSNGFYATIKARYETLPNNGQLRFGYIINGETKHFLRDTVSNSDRIEIGLSGEGMVNKKYLVPPGSVELFVQFTSNAISAVSFVTVEKILLEPTIDK